MFLSCLRLFVIVLWVFKYQILHTISICKLQVVQIKEKIQKMLQLKKETNLYRVGLVIKPNAAKIIHSRVVHI